MDSYRGHLFYTLEEHLEGVGFVAFHHKDRVRRVAGLHKDPVAGFGAELGDRLRRFINGLDHETGFRFPRFREEDRPQAIPRREGAASPSFYWIAADAGIESGARMVSP